MCTEDIQPVNNNLLHKLPFVFNCLGTGGRTDLIDQRNKVLHLDLSLQFATVAFRW